MRATIACLLLGAAHCAPPGIAAYHTASKSHGLVSAYEQIAVVTTCRFEAGLDDLRALVGSLHRVRAGRGHVPSVWVVHYGSVPQPAAEEIGWWSNVRLVASDGTDTTSVSSVLEEAAKTSTAAVFVPLGLELDATKLDAAEWAAANAWLAGDTRSAVRLVENFVQMYAQKRSALVHLAMAAENNGCVCDSRHSVRACTSGYCARPKCSSAIAPFGTISSKHGRCSKDVVPHPADGVRVVAREIFQQSRKPFVALGVPSTSRGLMNYAEHPIVGMLSRTLADSVAHSSDGQELRLYIAYDRGDSLFGDAKNKKRLLDALRKTTVCGRPLYAAVVLMEAPHVQRVAALWDALYRQALADGASSFLQINDDVRISAPNLIQKLQSMLPADGLPGVAAPADANHAWGCTLHTQALVGPAHGRVFGALYAPELRDWTTDRWLTEVYRALGRAACDPALGVSNGGVPRRYDACDMPSWPLYVLDAIIALEAGTGGKLAFTWPTID